MKSKFTIYIGLTVMVFLLETQVSLIQACWGGPVWYGYQFWKPDITDTEEFNAYLISFKSLYDYDIEAYNQQETDNIAEWKSSVCEIATEEEIKNFVYKATVGQRDSVLRKAQGEGLPYPKDLVGNGFVEHLVETKCIETLEYLKYAKEIEPNVVVRYYWDDTKRDESGMRSLLSQGKSGIKKAKNDYIKLRYAYQVIRLAHYLGEFEEAADLYDKYIPKLAKKSKGSIILNWATAHKAGALKSIGDRAEAAYLFSKVFDGSKSKREAAYRSFDVSSDKEWKAVLALCKTKEEEANLYFMRGIDINSVATEEMRKIYEIAPDSKKLEFLLVREIQKLENDLLGREVGNYDEFDLEYFGYPRAEADEYIVEVSDLVDRIVQEGKVANKDLWTMAQGYLEYLGGDLQAADATFAKVKSNTSDAKIKQQVEAFELASKITSIKTMTPSLEEEMYQIFTQKKALLEAFPDFKNFINDKLNFVYKKQKDLAKAYLSKPDLYELRSTNDWKTVDALIELGRKSNKNNFEKFLMDNKQLNMFVEMRGTYQLAKYKLEDALATFEELPSNYQYEATFDPFNESVKDCNNCSPNKNATPYNKKTLVKKMIELREKATTDTTDYESVFQLGLAFYNITYYGSAWNAADYYRPYGNYIPNEYYKDKDGNFAENYNIQPALIAFEAALDRAAGPEFAAKAAFWASKCQLIQYYNSPDSKEYKAWGIEAPKLPAKYTTYFEKLDENFSNTDYYDMVIKECSYFKLYTQQ